MDSREITYSKPADTTVWIIIQTLGTVFKENFIIFSLAAIFVEIIKIVVLFNEKPGYINWVLKPIDNFTFLMLSFVLAGELAKRLTDSRREAELRQIYDDMPPSNVNLSRLGGVLVICFIIPFFIKSFGTYKQLFPSIRPFSLDGLFMKIDSVLHFGHHPWMLLQPLLGYPIITCALDSIYMFWFPIMFAFMWGMAWSTKRHLRGRFFICFIFLWFFLGTFLATLLSSAGPCYYGAVTGLKDPYVQLMTYLKEVDRAHPLFALLNQQGLWEGYTHGIFQPFGGISAMPSMHVAGAVLFAMVGWKIKPWLGALLWGYALLILFGSVHLGWHYAIDGYVSVLLTYLIWKASAWAINSTD